MSEAELTQEISTQEGYALWAASYDQENNALIALDDAYVDQLLTQISVTRVLDVGAGTGRYALKLARQGAHVTALDQSPEMLAVARQVALSEGLSIDFRLASVEDALPFDDAQFDLVTCALMLCHVPDLSGAVREFARVLQPGGHLIITDFHPDCVDFGWRTRFEQAEMKYHLPNMPHSRADYLESLTAQGLSLLKVVDLPIRALPAGYPMPQIMLSHLDMSLCLVVVAQKEA
jgi:ubiquinone biosynthesis O-methyltransferase